jgi:CRP-like cAMP-binding protein
MADRLIARDIFAFLRPEQMHAISESAEKIRLGAGEMVYERGNKADYFYTVLEGEVTLRLPVESGVSIVIDELTNGEMFGSCMCLSMDSYALSAQCVTDSVLLKIESAVLKGLMDEEVNLGYAMQSEISALYFRRYIDTALKLHAVVMNLPIQAG